MFLIFGPAQTRRQLQIAEDIVIGLAEPGIGIQRIGILAEEIIVPLLLRLVSGLGSIYVQPIAAARLQLMRDRIRIC